MLRRFVFPACLLLSVPAQGLSVTPTNLVYDGVTVIDGTGAAPKPGMAIIVWDGRIKAIVPSSQWRRVLGADVRNARVTKLDGDYALPGLIDTHVHLATEVPIRLLHERAELRRLHL